MGTAQLFDIAAAVVLITFGFVGCIRGFIRSVMTFVGLFCGVYFAWKFSDEGTRLFLIYFSEVDASIASVIATAIIFFGVSIAISLLSRLLCSLANFAQLSGINHIAGVFIGLATGYILIIVVYGVLTLLAPEAGHGWMNHSIFMNLTEKIWPYVYNFLLSRRLDPVRTII